MHKEPPLSKVFYRPIEAAIRWAGLLRYKASILASIASPRCLPQMLDCPRWNECRLYSERIYDGILNSELPFGKDGITINDPELVSSPDLTVRHVDLKRWMRTHYPEHRPGFLFSRGERMAHPFITLETGQALYWNGWLCRLRWTIAGVRHANCKRSTKPCSSSRRSCWRLSSARSVIEQRPHT